MYVQVAVCENRGVNTDTLCIGADMLQGNSRRFLHDITEVAGEGEFLAFCGR